MASLALAGAMMVFATACSGPDLHLDPAPAPKWTSGEMKAGGSVLTSVGSAPVTIDTSRDVDIATDDATARLARYFDSQVVSRASDWSVALQAGSHETQVNVAEQSTRVQSNVRVENVVVRERYRDAATQQQFVRIEVDRQAWLSGLHQRVDRAFSALAANADAAESAVAQKHLFAAYKEVLTGQNAGQVLEPDVIVMDMLDPQAGAFAKLKSLRQRLAASRGQLSERFACNVQVQSGADDASTRLRDRLESFFQQQGLAVGTASNAARVVVTTGERFTQVAQVANRQEQVHAATGSIRVFEPDGREVPELAVTLGDDQTERDVDATRARQKALDLAADALASKFRSAFRMNFQP